MTPQERWEDFKYRNDTEARMAPIREKFEQELARYRQGRIGNDEEGVYFFDGQ